MGDTGRVPRLEVRMPWTETTPMKELVKFIGQWEAKVYRFGELCSRYGISRKTGYKWLERFEREGLDGLRPRSRAPKSCPHRMAQASAEAIVAARRKHPSWGGRKILDYLRRHRPELVLPASSTAGDLLGREGLVVPRRRRAPWRHPGNPRVRPMAPNELWTADFKGQFRTRDRVYCYPLTIADEHTRYLLRCQGLFSVRTEEAWPVFKRLFEEVGLPRAIRTDNGSPFSSTGLHGLCALSVWWVRLGIQHQRITPGHPEENPCHERMHRTVKAETARPPAANRRAQQRRFNLFREEYNEIRPHEALGGDPPASRWKPPTRPYPARMPEPDYPGHFETRWVSNAGTFRFKKHPLFLSQALNGEQIGLDEIDDGVWSVYFYDVLLARLDERKMTLFT
jgi:putative transposase